MNYFTIRGKGLTGYLRSIPLLRQVLKKKQYDLIHAHYLFSALIAGFSTSLPVVTSLMGSEAYSGKHWHLLTRYFAKKYWSAVIVKSEVIRKRLKLNHAHVIPNGVDFEKFKIIDREEALKKTGFNNKKHVLFIADPERNEKNFMLAKQAVNYLADDNVVLEVINNVKNDLIPYYMNAADLLILTSTREGSPNVIKEALCCNLPVVSTDVGDVAEITRGIEGAFISNPDAGEFAGKIKEALKFRGKMKSRDAVKYLDERNISGKIIEVYQRAIKK